MMTDLNNAIPIPQPGEAPNLSVILTIRLLMQGKEVGSIIGKRGDHIRSIREESNAKINISDGSCPERIVTITGSMEIINKAFAMICRKFEDDMLAIPNSVPKPPITMRLIVPATQCGSLIGKGGSKIKEIREATGASIQVASEMLPNSTERAVTISGTADAIIQCMVQICHIMLESPPKGATIPYRPKPSINPLFLASTAAAAAAAQQPQTTILPAGPSGFGAISPELTKIHPINPLFQPVPSFNPVYATSPYGPGLIASVPTSTGLDMQSTGDLRSVNKNGQLTTAGLTETQKAMAAAQAAQMNQLAGTDPMALSQYIINTSIATVDPLSQQLIGLPIQSTAGISPFGTNGIIHPNLITYIPALNSQTSISPSNLMKTGGLQQSQESVNQAAAAAFAAYYNAAQAGPYLAGTQSQRALTQNSVTPNGMPLPHSVSDGCTVPQNLVSSVPSANCYTVPVPNNIALNSMTVPTSNPYAYMAAGIPQPSHFDNLYGQVPTAPIDIKPTAAEASASGMLKTVKRYSPY